MKSLIVPMSLAFALLSTSCNNNDGSSISKGDPAIVHGGDTAGGSGGGSGSSPSKLGSGTTDAPSATPTPNADTGASKQNRVSSDTSANAKSHKVP